jgi:hypothetical protein
MPRIDEENRLTLFRVGAEESLSATKCANYRCGGNQALIVAETETRRTCISQWD